MIAWNSPLKNAHLVVNPRSVGTSGASAINVAETPLLQTD